MKVFFLAVCMLFVTGVYAQDDLQDLPLLSNSLTLSFSKRTHPIDQTFSFHKASQSKIIPINTISGIPKVDHLPSLFCRLEYRLESKSKLAPRFRLGSLNYTEWMEGKREFYMRY